MRVLWLVTAVRAAWDCSKVEHDGKQYDLSPLKDVRTVESFKMAPPSTIKSVYSISLCAPLANAGGSEDECPEGTRVCFKSFAQRDGLDDRLISVVPIAGDIGSASMNGVASGSDAQKWTLALDGGVYLDEKQSVEIDFTCDQNADPSVKPTLASVRSVRLTRAFKTTPAFYSYDGGKLKLTWTASAACPLSQDRPPSGDGDSGSGKDDGGGRVGMGFFGWLVTLIVIGFVAYFALGYYNNWTNYGATGWDAVPHRELWRELPGMAGDLFKGRGASRSGYNSLG